MQPKLRNILAGISGWAGGSIVNMSLVNVGHKTFPIPGVDPEDMEALAAVMPSLDYRYFIFPFLAHALGTLVGAFIAAVIATDTRKMRLAMIIGGLFLLGGIAINFILPAPIWFVAADIIFAYIPMAWLGGKLALSVLSRK